MSMPSKRTNPVSALCPGSAEARFNLGIDVDWSPFPVANDASPEGWAGLQQFLRHTRGVTLENGAPNPGSAAEKHCPIGDKCSKGVHRHGTICDFDRSTSRCHGPWLVIYIPTTVIEWQILQLRHPAMPSGTCRVLSDCVAWGRQRCGQAGDEHPEAPLLVERGCWETWIRACRVKCCAEQTV